MRSFVWLDDKSKKLTYWNRNYYFVTTLVIVLLNIILYASCEQPWITGQSRWGSYAVNNLVQALINSYWHANWQHVLLNMLCFFIAGLYLERKKGSLKFFLFVIVMSLFTAFACTTASISLWWVGFSAVNYGLYGYILFEFLFTCIRRDKRSLFNILVGVVIVGLIYFAMCFNGGTSEVSFVWYPYDLLNNTGHLSGFIVGLIFGLYEQVSSLISARQGKPPEKKMEIVERKVEEVFEDPRKRK